MKRRNMLRADFSVFMCIIFMLAGCLLVLLISNLAVVLVDPATVIISGIIRASGFEAGSSGNEEMTGKIYTGGNGCGGEDCIQQTIAHQFFND